MRIRNWSSDVCSSDLVPGVSYGDVFLENERQFSKWNFEVADTDTLFAGFKAAEGECQRAIAAQVPLAAYDQAIEASHLFNLLQRSEEHTSELQSLMRISYAVFCLKKKTNDTKKTR